MVVFQTHFKVTIGSETLSRMRWYMGQVGAANSDDLLAAIFLECWEAKKAGTVITEQEIRRSADRVRQRVIRAARRDAPTPAVERTPTVDLPPDDEAGLVIREFM